MKATVIFSKFAFLGVICILAASSMAGNEDIPFIPEQMSDEQLVEALAVPKQMLDASREIRRRLRRGGCDPDSSLAKLLLDTWKANDERRGACLMALRVVKSQEVVDILCRRLSEGATRQERVSAAYDLGSFEVASEQVVAALRLAVAEDQGAWHDGRSIAREAISSLGAMGSAGAEALMEIWDNERERKGFEKVAIAAMARTGDKRIITIFMDLLQTDRPQRFRSSAAWALGEMGSDAELPILREYENDPDAQVRENVELAIKKIKKLAHRDLIDVP